MKPRTSRSVADTLLVLLLAFGAAPAAAVDPSTVVHDPHVLETAFSPDNVLSSPSVLCDGVHDDGPGLQAALRSGRSRLVLPDTTCRSSIPLVGPSNADITIDGSAFGPGNPPVGSGITCDAGVSPCLTVGGSNKTATLSRLIVKGGGGGDIGLLVKDSYNPVLTDVMVYNFARCYRWEAHQATGLGLGGMNMRLFSGACRDAHLDIDSWPELRIEESRFGMNGLGDDAANTYVRIEGSTTVAFSGPNSISFLHNQFNQGSLLVHHGVEFVNLKPGAPYGPDIFRFEHNHLEAMDQAVIYSDASWRRIHDLDFSDNTVFSNPSAFLRLNAATSLETPVISYNNLQVADFIYAPHTQMNQFLFEGNVLNARMQITGPAHSQLSLRGNTFTHGLKLNGFNGGVLEVTGGAVFGGFDEAGLATALSKIVMVPGQTFEVVNPAGIGTSISGTVNVGADLNANRVQAIQDVVVGRTLSLLSSDGSVTPVIVGPSGSGPGGGTTKALYLAH